MEGEVDKEEWRNVVKERGGERWTRMCMGLSMSPYCSVQALAYAMEYVLGDRQDSKNPFQSEENHSNSCRLCPCRIFC